MKAIDRFIRDARIEGRKYACLCRAYRRAIADGIETNQREAIASVRRASRDRLIFLKGEIAGEKIMAAAKGLNKVEMPKVIATEPKASAKVGAKRGRPTKLALYAMLADKGREEAFVANVILCWHRNPARKLKGAAKLAAAGRTVRIGTTIDTLLVDGRPMAWSDLEGAV